MQIKIKNVSKKYNDLIIFDNLNLDIYSHDFVIIYGESGCGKTTLLQLISGINKPDKGEILYNGINIHENIQSFLSNHISYVFQDHRLLNELTVKDNIMMGVNFSNSNLDKEWYNLLCDELDITHLQTRKIIEISVGQRQRVAIARALIKKPDILLLDEPTGNLDKNNTLYLMEFLKKIYDKSNLTIIMVTHEISLKKYGNRIINIEKRNLSNLQVREESVSICKNELNEIKDESTKIHFSSVLKLVEMYINKHIIYYLFISFCLAICCISFFLSLNVGKNFEDYIRFVISEQEESKIINLDPVNSSDLIDISILEELKKLPYCEEVSYNLHKSYAFERSFDEAITLSYNNKTISDRDKIIDFFKQKNSSTLVEGQLNVAGNEIVIDESIVKDLDIKDPIGKQITIRLPIATCFKKMNISEYMDNSLENVVRYTPVNNCVEYDFVIKGVMKADYEENYTVIHDANYLKTIVMNNVKKFLADNEITSYATTNAYFVLDSVDHLQDALSYIEKNYDSINCSSKVITLAESLDNIAKVQTIYRIVNVFTFIALIGVITVVMIINFSRKQRFLAVMQFVGANLREYKLFIAIESCYIFVATCIFAILITQIFLPILNMILSNNPILELTEYVVEKNMYLFSLDTIQLIISLAIGAILIIGIQFISMVQLKKKSMIEILNWEVR